MCHGVRMLKIVSEQQEEKSLTSKARILLTPTSKKIPDLPVSEYSPSLSLSQTPSCDHVVARGVAISLASWDLRWESTLPAITHLELRPPGIRCKRRAISLAISDLHSGALAISDLQWESNSYLFIITLVKQNDIKPCQN